MIYAPEHIQTPIVVLIVLALVFASVALDRWLVRRAAARDNRDLADSCLTAESRRRSQRHSRWQ